jgi:peptide deformylase
MAIRPVLVLPDGALTRVSEPVPRVDAAARSVVADLVDTMRATPACVGLAAPQIGVALRAFVVDVSGHKKARSCHGELALLNPEVLVARDPVVAREGCLSVPHLTGDVARATSLVVRGLSPEGTERVVEVDAFEARAVLHEIDHLDGLLFLDRVTSRNAVFPRKVYR